MQLTLTIQTHDRENNPTSQDFLDQHKGLFEKSCFEVFKALIAGHELTTDNAKQLANTRSLPRRIKDLRDNNGIYISDAPIGDGTTCKKWFMTAEDKLKNLEQITRKLAA